jgi:hypothetical protein
MRPFEQGKTARHAHGDAGRDLWDGVT